MLLKPGKILAKAGVNPYSIHRDRGLWQRLILIRILSIGIGHGTPSGQWLPSLQGSSPGSLAATAG